MFNSLRKRLTWLYTVTTGCIILTIVMAGFLMFRLKEIKGDQLEQFRSIWGSVCSRVQFDSVIFHSWLSAAEADNRMIIHIEENGIPFLYHGSWPTQTDRKILIDRAKEAAAEQGVYTAIAPVSSSINTTNLLTLNGDNNDQYFAMALVMSTPGGVKSICAISYITPALELLKGTIIFLCAMDLLGIAGLFFVSWHFVGWSLKPVEESQRKQAEFIAAASHELRSPLSVLRSGTAAILAAPKQKEALLRTMDAECARMSRLISDMLLLASTDARTWSVYREETDLDTLLIETYEAFLPICREKNIKLLLDLPDETLPRISADRERLKQVLFILLDNALLYTTQGRTISLSAACQTIPRPMRHRRRLMRITVADQGCGIPDHIKAHIFDRFYKADSARSNKEHFGLGLSIAKELVTLHGGTIAVENNPGGGTRFIITLEAVKPSAR